jgi:hypothetical protein
MEMYSQQRDFGVEKSDALLSAIATGAYSSEGGRVAYVPKERSWKIKAGQRMETEYGAATDFITGGKAKIPDVKWFDPSVGPQPQEIKQPLIGGLGTDYTDPSILRRTEMPGINR